MRNVREAERERKAAREARAAARNSRHLERNSAEVRREVRRGVAAVGRSVRAVRGDVAAVGRAVLPTVGAVGAGVVTLADVTLEDARWLPWRPWSRPLLLPHLAFRDVVRPALAAHSTVASRYAVPCGVLDVSGAELELLALPGQLEARGVAAEHADGVRRAVTGLLDGYRLGAHGKLVRAR